MLVCMQGHEAPEGAKFCSECGTKVGLPTCNSCSAELKSDAKFCSACGTATVDTSAKSSVVNPSVEDRTSHQNLGSSTPEGQMVHEWLRGSGNWEIQQALSREGLGNLRVLGGGNGGRFLSYGVDLVVPTDSPMAALQSMQWALGLDTRIGLQMGRRPTGEPLYVGLRQNRNVTQDGFFRTLAPLLSDWEWRGRDQYWAFFTYPGYGTNKRPHEALPASVYASTVIDTYVSSFRQLKSIIDQSQ
jgi:hypothetical protein